MYESRSRHAKNRKRAQDGKFLPNTANANCSDDAMSDSTILKETARGSRSRSQDKQNRADNKKEDDNDSIYRGLSPNNLNHGENFRTDQSLNLTRNPSTISTDLFKTYENNDELEEMLFEDKTLSGKKENKETHQLLQLNKWASIDKQSEFEEPKLFHQDSLKVTGKRY